MLITPDGTPITWSVAGNIPYLGSGATAASVTVPTVGDDEMTSLLNQAGSNLRSDVVRRKPRDRVCNFCAAYSNHDAGPGASSSANGADVPLEGGEGASDDPDPTNDEVQDNHKGRKRRKNARPRFVAASIDPHAKASSL